ncbi:MAG: DNA polymerase III subunit gamma/tau [Aphanothece sp. CMT-3BRIN-NPC111]|jgi:DNA polymerase-3 subunit gamma/tau|nr:DNA polymerase III subunit gamma/tau [Aphanothece sp. CMT-3BRIN-NPC111]
MSYEPLHHKYRPQTFADLVGQEAIATTLGNAIHLRRIAPAYLFTGPRGTGKTSSARILAKSLNCLSGDVPTEVPCGVCDVCRAIAFGSALDIIEIDAASNTGVDNIREIIERAQFAPVQCRYKVYIIDEVHMLSTAAFNALLKTLEEPPARVVFVLATTDPQRVIPTILSRCQQFNFGRIPLDAMVKHLKEIAIKENIHITDQAVTLVAQVAQGGLRDAESLLDQLSLLAGEVTVEKVWDLVGAVPERDLMALLKAIASNNPEAVLDVARHLMERGREPNIVLQNLAGFYRDLLIAKTAPSRSDLVALTAPTWDALCEEAKNWETGNILAGSKYLKGSEAQIKNTTQPRLWLEVTLLGLLVSEVTQTSHTQQQISKIQNPSHGVETQTHVPAPSHKPEVQPPSSPASSSNPDVSQAQMPSEQVPKVSPTQEQREQPESTFSVSQPAEVSAQQSDLKQVWQQVIDHIQQRSTQVLLNQHGRLIAVRGAVAHVGIKTQPLLKLVQGGLPHVEAAFEQVFQHKMKVSLQVVSATESKSAAANLPPSPSTDSKSVASPEVKPDSATNYQATASPSQVYSKIQPQASSTAEITPHPRQPAQQLRSPDPGVPGEEAAEVENAARHLAKFFCGEIMQMAEERDFTEPHTTQLQGREIIDSVVELESEPEEWQDDDDMPF